MKLPRRTARPRAPLHLRSRVLRVALGAGLPWALASLAACAGTDQASVSTVAGTPTDAARQTTTDSAGGAIATPVGVTATAATTPPRPSGPSIATFTSGDSAAPVVKGLYVNRFAAQSSRRMRQLIAMADSTEVNALVIDLKDEFGLNYVSRDAAVNRNAGDPDKGKIRDVRALTDTLRAHKILPIARIVVFKDPWAAKANPDHVIRKPDGGIWIDKAGNVWVNPYDRYIWEYNLKVAEEAVALGFGEIQFDYIRFPEPYKSLPPQVFAGANGVSKPDAIANFLKEANARLDKLGVRVTADVFGLTTTVGGPLEVAQHWERLAPVTDVLLPMTYPSHYPRGSFGVARPNADPYTIQKMAIAKAKERNAKLGITGERVRPWIQAFTLGAPAYDGSHVREQIRGINDAGYQGWVLWHPGSKYEPFLSGLKKEP
jgi:hypothetical protein